MKKIAFSIIVLTLISITMNWQVNGNNYSKSKKTSQFSPKMNIPITPEELLKHITWISQACVRIQYQDLIIYSDPYLISNKETADIIIITHLHGDHLSIEDIDKLFVKGKTRIIAAEACAEKLKKYEESVTYLNPDQRVTFSDIEFHAVRAYNIVKTNHPKSSNFIGMIMNIDDVLLYITGDTERIPEMTTNICDIIMLPLGQVYTMNSVDEAVQAVLDTKAKIAVPIHYGLYEGKLDDALSFKKKLEGKVKVEIMTPTSK